MDRWRFQHEGQMWLIVLDPYQEGPGEGGDTEGVDEPGLPRA